MGTGKALLVLDPQKSPKNTGNESMHVSFDTPTQVTINDKRDDFTFRIVTFPFMCSNVPAVLAYGIYISQLVRMGRICDRYEHFVRKNKEVTTR